MFRFSLFTDFVIHAAVKEPHYMTVFIKDPNPKRMYKLLVNIPIAKEGNQSQLPLTIIKVVIVSNIETE